MKRLLMFSALTCLMTIALAGTASAQQIHWVPQTYGPAMPTTYQHRVSPGNTVTIPYWQAYGAYHPAYPSYGGLPQRDALPARNTWNGFYSTTGQSFGGFNRGTTQPAQGRANGDRPIQSNPRSSGSRGRVYVKLR